MRRWISGARSAVAMALTVAAAGAVTVSEAQAASLSAAPVAADVDVVGIIMAAFALIGDVLRLVAAIVNAAT